MFGLLQYLQLTIFYVFIIQRVEELVQLINFIEFQRLLRVEDLSIVNDRFHSQENRIAKEFKLAKIVVSVTMALLFVLTQLLAYKNIAIEILSSMI